MITLYDVLNILNYECEVEVFEWDLSLLQEGKRGPTDWNKDLLDRRVHRIFPGIVTKIFLDCEY